MSEPETPAPVGAATPRPRPLTPLLGAIAFLVCYLAVDFAVGAVGTGTMPLPGEDPEGVYEYLRANTTGSILTSVLQALSVLGLAVVVAGPAAEVGSPAGGGRRRAAVIVGGTAVIAMLASAGLSIAMGLVADSSSMDTVVALRNIGFYTGGAAHIVALGLFVLILSGGEGWTRPVKVMGWVAGVPAVLSILSVFVFYASPLLPVGRLLCMVCLVVAGASLARGRSPIAR
ncbi:hypothetical protein [Glycomyces harbinensis]|uniref:DUF4386 domain-containing protein n=1 Tax=Glycomyces harbinensis TaxID=58114 RepID=A0A1G7AFV1_9ACTN|nr:hypothetical protein [Glycomyces harbinensis]SDE12915.1 hypothetical protein SAMN05216270_11382 [Glycomyces harbinensis]